jgi:large subunit ribosomal protein L9
MELILLERVKNLGDLGDKVTVRPGYGRNFLLPQGKAVPVTAENLADFESRRAELELKQADKLAAAKARAEQLSEAVLIIARRAGAEGKLFGSVNAADIADAADVLGIELSKAEVRLPLGPLRMVDDYEVAVHLHSDVDTVVKVHVVAEEEDEA